MKIVIDPGHGAPDGGAVGPKGTREADITDANGFEIYTTPGRDHSDQLATAIFEAWSRMFPHQRRRTDTSDGDPDKEANYLVLRECRVPAVLVEMAFISNPQEEAFLRSAANHDAMAAAVADGIEAWERKRRG